MFYVNFLISLFIGVSLGAPFSLPSFITEPINAEIQVPDVPFYSQFYDIHQIRWQKLGCGIADLAMLIEFYQPGTVSVDTLLQEGINDGAFINGAGWSHAGLVNLARKYNLDGATYDFSYLNDEDAFAQLEKSLKNGPVIASVHYTFDPQNPIPHLVVMNGIYGNTMYYNDPSEASAGNPISISDFMKGWKKRFIEIRPYL